MTVCRHRRSALDASRGGDQNPAPDLTQATAEHLDFLPNRYRYLDLRGMGITDLG